MTIDEYFGDWMKVLDRAETMMVMGWLKTINPDTLCPTLPNVFKAFKLCPYNKLRVICIGQDPYNDKFMGNTRATGILFGNSKIIPEDELSPSLQVIKESVINFEIPHNIITFDNSLESWAKQGILLINSALTCKLNEASSHSNEWRPFISKLLKNLSDKNSGLIYILFGRQAQSLKPYIDESLNDIIEIEHPAYFARTKRIMPYSVFKQMNIILYNKYGETITLFNEEKYENTGN